MNVTVSDQEWANMGYATNFHISLPDPVDEDNVKTFTSAKLQIEFTYVPSSIYSIYTGTSSSFSYLSRSLPGAYTLVDCPGSEECMGKIGPYLIFHYKKIALRDAVIHLNDDHMWSRDDIADWLESIHDPTGVDGPNLNFGVNND